MKKSLTKSFKKLTDANTSWWEKTKDILLNVAIMVFSFSLSIQLHNFNEKRTQKADVKKFLLGLKEDLKGDIKEMEADRASYLIQGKAFTYFANVSLKDTIPLDSLKKHSNTIFLINFPIPNDSRFEGFKSAGKLGGIENDKLQNDILDLYQDEISGLVRNTQFYIKTKERMIEFFIDKQVRIDSKKTNFANLLKSDKGRNLCYYLSQVEGVAESYSVCIDKMKSITTQIDEEYGLKNE
jgi:hypothetical protein